MGGCYSSRPVKTGAASLPLRTRTSKGATNAQSSISKLPVELLSSIFKKCDHQIRARLVLTHTCQRWRLIAVNDPSLWVNVQIDTSSRKPDARLSHFISLLGMQLDRTGNLLLEVEWYARLDLKDDFLFGSLDIIRTKAPFARWRSLTVWMSGRLDKDLFGPGDTFMNLESLTVRHGTINEALSAIDRMVRSRLKVLDLGGEPFGWEELLRTSLPRCLAHASSLTISRLHNQRQTKTLFLPANIKSLRLVNQYTGSHSFPYVRTYELMTCKFWHGEYDLRNMTTMTVGGLLRVHDNCHLLLPALREFRLVSISMGLNSIVETPALETLHFMEGETLFTNESLQKPECFLSPKTSLIVDSSLSVQAIFTIIINSPHLTHLKFRFQVWAEAQEVLAVLFGAKERRILGDWEHLCPRLVEIRLEFNWYLSEQLPMEPWSTTPPVVYATWKGEGTYKILAST